MTHPGGKPRADQQGAQVQSVDGSWWLITPCDTKGAPTFHAFIKLQYYRHGSFITDRYANYRSIRNLQ